MKIYFATGNSGKVQHAQNILSDHEVRQLDIETVEPSVDSIKQIALSKVEQATEKSDLKDGELLIADDSGLFIEELNGFPGPQTHFFDRKVGKEKILDLVNPGSNAEFRAAVALYRPDAENRVFTGKAEGAIVEPRGDGGFGYDPIFLPDGNDETWAEDPGYKDRNSHREKALSKLENYLGNELK
jgi:XTP/dITP diphosphohydrolase